MLLSLSYFAARRLLRLLTGSGERDDAARVSELTAEVSSLCDSSGGHGCEPSSTNCSAAFSAASKATSDVPTRFHSSAESPHAALRRAHSGLPLDELPICQTDSCRPRTLTRGAARRAVETVVTPRLLRLAQRSQEWLVTHLNPPSPSARPVYHGSGIAAMALPVVPQQAHETSATVATFTTCGTAMPRRS
jgi:hypothetical protein